MSKPLLLKDLLGTLFVRKQYHKKQLTNMTELKDAINNKPIFKDRQVDVNLLQENGDDDGSTFINGISKFSKFHYKIVFREVKITP